MGILGLGWADEAWTPPVWLAGLLAALGLRPRQFGIVQAVVVDAELQDQAGGSQS